MVRQGYLDKVKIALAGQSQPQKGKRGRGSMVNDSDERENYNWRWGARALAEIGEEGIVDFITHFMVDKGNVVEEEEEEEGTPGTANANSARKEEELK